MVKKLNSIVIRRVEFRNASLEEALWVLRQRAAELDSETNNEFRGINLVVLQPEGIEARKINGDLKDVSLGGALNEVAKQAKLSVKVDQFAICLTPPKVADERDRANAPAIVAPQGKAAETAAEINIPRVSFENASLAEAVEFVNLRSAEVSGEKNMVPRIVLDPSANPQATIKELHLRNVPLSEVLRYCCDLTRHVWTADDTRLIVKPSVK